LQGVEKHSIVDFTHLEAASIVAGLEAHSFENGQPTVDLGNALLNSSVLQVHPSELLIARFTLDIFDECVDCLKAGLGDARRSDLRVQSLHRLDTVLDELSGRLLLGLFLGGRS